MEDIKKNPILSMLKENQSQEICDFIIEKAPAYFKHFKEEYKNEFNCFIAVTYNSEYLKYVPEHLQSKKIVDYCLKDSPLNISYVKNQTEDMCFNSVKLNVSSFKFCKHQSELMCKIALKKNILNFQYINQVVPEYINIILKEEKNNLHYFFNQLNPEGIDKFKNHLSFEDEKTILKKSVLFIEHLNQNIDNCLLSLSLGKENTPDLFELIKIVNSSSNEECFELLMTKKQILKEMQGA